MTRKQQKQKKTKKNKVTEIINWATNKVKKIYRVAFNQFSIQANKNNSKNNEEQPHKSRRRAIKNRLHKRFQAQHKQPNEKLDKLCCKKTAQNSSAQFNCPICLNMLVFPVVTPCQHIFCFKCLEQDMLLRANCAVCRAPIRQQIQVAVCPKFQQIINEKVETILTPEQLKLYEERQQEDIKYIQARSINQKNIKEGDQIDVRDTQLIWCKAVIKKVHLNESLDKQLRTIESIQIHYSGWSQVFDEKIKIDSKRLAPKGVFTQRTDIPRYNLEDRSNSLRAPLFSFIEQRIQLRLANSVNILDFFMIQNFDRANVQTRIRQASNRFNRQLGIQNEFIPFLQIENSQPQHMQLEWIQNNQSELSIPLLIDQNSNPSQSRQPQIRRNSLLQRLNPSNSEFGIIDIPFQQLQQPQSQISFSDDQQEN